MELVWEIVLGTPNVRFRNNVCIKSLRYSSAECFQKQPPEVFYKKVFLKISQNSQGNTCARFSFLRKLQASACNFIKKEILSQLFSCEGVFKNTFLTEHLWVTASMFLYRKVIFRFNKIHCRRNVCTQPKSKDTKNLHITFRMS